MHYTPDESDNNTTASYLQLHSTCFKTLTHRLAGWEDANCFKRVLTADEALAKLAFVEGDAWIESQAACL